MSVIFQDEYNELSFIIIGYSGATVPVLNYSLAVRSTASLATASTTVL